LGPLNPPIDKDDNWLFCYIRHYVKPDRQHGYRPKG